MTLRSLVAVTAVLVAPSLAVGAADPLAHANGLPPSLEWKAQAVAAELQREGFAVARGYSKLFDIEECKWPISVIGNCYGNNPTAPYIVPVVPTWRDEYVDRTLHLAVGPVHRSDSAIYRLAEREAVVLLAEMPPPGAYFGVQTYVFSRKVSLNLLDPLYLRLETSDPALADLLFDPAPDPSRTLVFSSIGNSNNNVTIGDAWGEQRFFVISPDAAMVASVKAALKAVGVPGGHVFAEPVSRDLVRLGLDADDDDLLTLVRYALPDDAVAVEAADWRQRTPIAVLRVRDMATLQASAPYPTPGYDRRFATDENWLAGDLTALVAAIEAEGGQPAATCAGAFINTYLDVDLVGQHCLARPMNCLGDTQDTDSYQVSPPFVLDPPGKLVAIVGALGTETGNATYVSLSVNRFAVLQGVMNLSQRELTGSAAGYGIAHGDKLYAFYLSRSCPAGTKAPCYEVPEDAVPRGETIKVMQRNYVHPGTARGADPGTRGAENLLRPRLVRLDPAACPATPTAAP